MKKFLTGLVVLVLGVGMACAYRVNVKVVDAVGEPESFATCRIFAVGDSLKAIAVGVADSIGYFSTTLTDSGEYRLNVTAPVGTAYVNRTFAINPGEEMTDLGVVTLGEAENLDEVVVTAQRPLVSRGIDRIGYDVQADPDVATINLQDVMRRVPMIAVDSEGNITVNGSSNFKIYKNGRPNNAFTKNAKDIFKALPASTIKTIEVITEPGAKYDAEGIGAILNIVTVDGARIDGVMGNVSVYYDSMRDWPQVNAFLTTQINKVTISLNGGYSQMSGRQSESDSESDYVYDNGMHRTGKSHRDSHGYFSWFGGEASYDINKHHLVTAEIDGYYYSTKPNVTGSYTLTDAEGNIINGATYVNPYDDYHYLSMDAAFNYQYTTDRDGETVTTSYMLSNTDQHSAYSNLYSDIQGSMLDYTGKYTDSQEKFQEHTFQVDWIRPFGGKHNLDIGAKYIYRYNRSKDNIDYEGRDDTFSDFKHLTDIGAAYAQYTGKFGRFNIRGGLRYEYSRMRALFPDKRQEDFGSSLNDFVPSASASWQVNDANSLTFNYATRINRPGISYLNPMVFEGPLTINHGNPDLESAMNHSMKLSYMLIKPKINVNFSAQYSFNNDNISEVSFINDQGLVVSTYDNIGRSRNLSFSFFGQWSPTAKTRLMLNASVNRVALRQGDLAQSRWGGYGYMRVTQQLPWDLSLEGFANMYFPGLYSVYSYMERSRFLNFWGLSLSRSFLKEKRLTVRLSANNFIGSSKDYYRTKYVNGDYTGTDWSRYSAYKSVSVSVSYRFGSLNASVKKTASAISNDDVVGGTGRK